MDIKRNTITVQQQLYLVLVHQVIEDLGWPHGDLSLDGINLVVASYITGRSLAFNQVLSSNNNVTSQNKYLYQIPSE